MYTFTSVVFATHFISYLHNHWSSVKSNKVIVIRRELPDDVTLTTPLGRSFFGSSQPVLFFFNIDLWMEYFFRLILFPDFERPFK